MDGRKDGWMDYGQTNEWLIEWKDGITGKLMDKSSDGDG